MIKIAICDNEADAIQRNEAVLLECIRQTKVIAEIENYTNGDMLLCDILEDNYFYDLILLDIEMPEISGMEIVHAIKPKLPNVKVIFITSHIQYAIDSFELNIFRYVPKDDLEKRLTYAVMDAVKLIMLENARYYTVMTANRMEKVNFADIHFIQRDGKNSSINTVQGTIQVRKSLQKVYEELDAEEFIFIERGCIINLLHIRQIKNGMIYLKNEFEFPVSRSHLQSVKQAVNSYWGKHI